MRSVFVLVALSLVLAVSAAKPHHTKVLQPESLIETAGGPDPDNVENIQDEINLTPYVVLTKEMQWKAGVPNYEDPKGPMSVKTFKTESAARKWVYKNTGAHQSINYPMAEGLNPANDAVGDVDLLEEGSAEEGSGSGVEGSAEEGSEEGSAEEGSGAESEDPTYCAECQKKLEAVNARIGEIESKLAARKDGGAITGITATKGEVIDVTIHREGDEGGTAFVEEGSGSDEEEGSGSDEEGSDEEATAFLEYGSEAEGSDEEGSGSEEEGSGSDAEATAFLEFGVELGYDGSDAEGSEEEGSGSDEEGSADATAFLEYGSDAEGSDEGSAEEGSGSDEEGSDGVATAFLEYGYDGSDGSDVEGSEEEGSGSDEEGSAEATAFLEYDGSDGSEEEGSGSDEEGSAEATAFLEYGSDAGSDGSDEEGSGSDEEGSAEATAFLEYGSDSEGSGSDEEGSGSDEEGSAATSFIEKMSILRKRKRN